MRRHEKSAVQGPSFSLHPATGSASSASGSGKSSLAADAGGSGARRRAAFARRRRARSVSRSARPSNCYLPQDVELLAALWRRTSPLSVPQDARPVIAAPVPLAVTT